MVFIIYCTWVKMNGICACFLVVVASAIAFFAVDFVWPTQTYGLIEIYSTIDLPLPLAWQSILPLHFPTRQNSHVV